MRKSFLSILLLCSIATYAQEATSGNGGQLIKNHSFEEEAKPIRNRRFGPNGEGELFGGYLPQVLFPDGLAPIAKEPFRKWRLRRRNS